MLAGIRTHDLCKIYTSPPPLASGGGFGFAAARGKGKKQPKPKIVALDGISLEISPEKSSACSVRTARANRRRLES